MIEEIVRRPNWAASIFFRDTLGYVGRSIQPIFTYHEILEWARVKARRDPKYKRIFKAKRYVSIKTRETTPRSYCSKKQLRRCFACSTIIEMRDGKTLVVPSQAHIDSWIASQREKSANHEKTDLFPLPPCPVDVFREIGLNVCIKGFCSANFPGDFAGRGDRKDYVFRDEKEIAKIEATPVGNPDPLEPRPWLSWNDCHVKDCETPLLDMHWLENRPFSEWEDTGDVYVCLDKV